MVNLTMINISASKHLDIILPNTNKALEQIIKSASPKELQTLSKGKDLKSVMHNILKQSADNSSSNKNLLELVKNNPTLKNLGDVSTTLKDLAHSIKSDKNPLPLEKVLKTFLGDIKDLKNSELKSKLENSGLFLESKLKDSKNPQVELKTVLQSLEKNLLSSDVTSTKTILKQIKELLNSNNLKSASNSDLTKDIKQNPKSLQTLASNVDSIIKKLSAEIKGADSINKPIFLKIVEKLEHQISPKILTPENFKLSSLKESLEQLQTHISKSLTPESKSLINSLEKILKTVKSEVPIEQLINKKIPQEITKLIDTIKDVIQKSDPIFSKDVTKILDKLKTLNTIEKLNPQNNIKEIIKNDLKSVLLQTKEELVKSNNPNQNEIIKNIDKLSLQIDYSQLVTHLSNSSSLYLPFSWDSLEEGEIELKHGKNDKFYCDIYLKLKEYGELNLKLTLYEKNQLNLHIHSADEQFKNIVKENIPSLRSALIDIQITPREIRILAPKKEIPQSPYSNYEDNFKMGFEVKG